MEHGAFGANKISLGKASGKGGDKEIGMTERDVKWEERERNWPDAHVVCVSVVYVLYTETGRNKVQVGFCSVCIWFTDNYVLSSLFVHK